MKGSQSIAPGIAIRVMIIPATARLTMNLVRKIATPLGVDASSSSLMTAETVYPESSMVWRRSDMPVTPGMYSMVACSESRWTPAEVTPSTAASAFSTTLALGASAMPAIANVTASVPTP